MLNHPKVSIVMPVYNGGKYFEVALLSALAQTYNNIEIIVVNDGSTDGGETDNIARKYGSRIVYISQPNKGVSGALNAAISYMTGDFFSWLSHDDVYLPRKVESQIKFHRQVGKSNAILFSDYKLIDASGKAFYETDFDLADLMRRPLMPLHRGYVNGCTLLVPSFIMKKYYPFDEGLKYTQDYDLWMDVSRDHEFFLQKESLVHYRVHPSQDSNKPGSLVERNSLFARMMDDRLETERVQLAGSERKFFQDNSEYYGRALIKEAADYAQRRADEWDPAAALVSVIIPVQVGDDLLKALDSILRQTHHRLEVLVVTTESSINAEVDFALTCDPRVRHVIANVEEELLNVGMQNARGTYIAFADTSGRFVESKISTQLDAMTIAGYVVSHTSYLVSSLAPEDGRSVVSAAPFTGNLYPGVLDQSLISLSTAMIHRSVFLGGFLVKWGGPASDALAVINLAQRHALLGVEEVLSVFELGHQNISCDELKHARLNALIKELCKDYVHSRQGEQLGRLKNARDRLATQLNKALAGDVASDRRKAMLEGVDVGYRKQSLALVQPDLVWNDDFLARIGREPSTIIDARMIARAVGECPPPSPRPDAPVLFVSWTLARGGAERLLAIAYERLRKRLAPRPVELLLMDCDSERGTDFYLPLTGLRRDEVHVQRRVEELELPYSSLQAPFANAQQWLVETLAQLKPSAVYCHLEVPNLLGGLAAVLTGVPRIVLGTYNMRPSDFIDDEDQLFWYREGYSQLLKRPEVRLTGMANALIDDYADWLGFDLSSRASIVPSGFDMSLFHSALDPGASERARNALGISRQVPVVGVVMRIASPKAPIFWVDVAAAVVRHRPDAVFVVIGDGPLLGDMREAVDRLDIGKSFVFTGAVADVYLLFPSFDVFLLTSISEGMPNVLIEAQASGVPVVARDVGAVRDTMVSGRTGRIIDGEDPARFASAILAYLDNPDLAKRSGREAQRFARRSFGVEHMVDRIQQILAI